MTSSKTALFASVSLAALLVSGCTHSLQTEDRIGFHAGDAQARNKALQMIEPWPRYAERTHIHGDGESAVRAVGAYKSGQVGTN